MANWHFSKPRIPVRAVIISIAALAVPFLASQWSSEASNSVLVWLVALIPAFLLAYYRGWQGAATALAAAMATLALSNVVLLMRGGSLDEGWLLGLISGFIVLSLGLGWLSEALHANRERAELVALTDELTSLPNRRRVRMYLEQELANESAGKLAVVLFDLDNFKAYNDRHGHPAGDVVLCQFAELLTALTPPDGMAARYGGEEFMAVLSNCDEGSAADFAERVRAALSRRLAVTERVTVCAGVAGGTGTEQPNELIVRADRALYEAKQTGRNCVRRASALSAAHEKGK